MSDKPKWTPGPLEVGMEEWAPGADLTISQEGAMIGEVYGFDNFPCFESSEGAEADFNARQIAFAQLFAAAPDLYQALEGLLRFVYGTAAYKTGRLGKNGAHGKALRALAKARGEKA